MCKTNRKEIGITLIALVVTIIILLILAGVTIGVATNGTGLFEKAKLATDEYNNKAQQEEKEIAKYSNEIEYFTRAGGSSSGYRETILLDTPTDSGVVIFKDGHNIDEFDAIEFLFATKSTKIDAFTTTEYKTSDWNYIIDNYNKNNSSAVGLYGYDDRYIDFNDLTKTGFTIRAANKHIIMRIIGINY